jgi:hypothetical protein
MPLLPKIASSGLLIGLRAEAITPTFMLASFNARACSRKKLPCQSVALLGYHDGMIKTCIKNPAHLASTTKKSGIGIH